MNPASENRARCRFLLSAIKKYGEESFTLSLLPCCPSLLNDLEIETITELNSIAPNGYNLLSGGGCGRVMSAESRAKISKSKKGVKMSESARINMRVSNKGKRLGAKHTEETKKKMSISKKQAVGEKNPASKLSEIDVINIRNNLSLGTTLTSRKYGVSKTTIKRIRNGKSWTHILTPPKKISDE
jgi:group I intron endonuclease